MLNVTNAARQPMGLEDGEIGLKPHIYHNVSVLRHQADSLGKLKEFNGGVGPV